MPNCRVMDTEPPSECQRNGHCGHVSLRDGAGLVVLPVGGRSQPHFREGPPRTRPSHAPKLGGPSRKCGSLRASAGRTTNPDPATHPTARALPKKTGCNTRAPSLEVALRAGAPAAQAAEQRFNTRSRRHPDSRRGDAKHPTPCNTEGPRLRTGRRCPVMWRGSPCRSRASGGRWASRHR